MTITDKELKRLLREPGGEHSEIERMSDKHLTRFAVECARELLAARKVVRMTRDLLEGGTGSRAALTKVLAAYDKARKGTPTYARHGECAIDLSFLPARMSPRQDDGCVTCGYDPCLCDQQ